MDGQEEDTHERQERTQAQAMDELGGSSERIVACTEDITGQLCLDRDLKAEKAVAYILLRYSLLGVLINHVYTF